MFERAENLDKHKFRQSVRMAGLDINKLGGGKKDNSEGVGQVGKAIMPEIQVNLLKSGRHFFTVMIDYIDQVLNVKSFEVFLFLLLAYIFICVFLFLLYYVKFSYRKNF
jgi:hypothetical protein